MFHKKTIRDIRLRNKTVLLRVDYSIPIENGEIKSDFRIIQTLPTLQYLLRKNCKIVICSHLGRPKEKGDKEFSLQPVAERLSLILRKKVKFSHDCIGEERDKAVKNLENGQILMLENLRYYPEEKANDKKFAAELAKGIDVFVQDGFGVVHRKHASTSAITKILPSVSGMLVEKEALTITQAMHQPRRPLMAIVGGAKISDKIDVLNRFIKLAEIVVIGGAMSNTFLLAEGEEVGDSLAERGEEVELAKEIIAKAKEKARKGNFVFYIPQDGVVASEVSSKVKTRIVGWGTNQIASIQSYPERPPKDTRTVGKNEKILDIGPFSSAFIAGAMQLAETVIWNGSMGVTEIEPENGAESGPFEQGTSLIVDAMLGHFGYRPQVIVGGGDTVGYIEANGLTESFHHVSTGGGASMDLLSGKKLPGVEALLDA